MPAQTTITIDDSAAASHDFDPAGFDNNGVAIFREAGAVRIADSVLTASVKTGADSKQKLRFVLKIPTVVTETINGVDRPVIARTAYADLQLSFDGEATDLERADTATLMKELIFNAALFNTFAEGEAIW